MKLLIEGKEVDYGSCAAMLRNGGKIVTPADPGRYIVAYSERDYDSQFRAMPPLERKWSGAQIEYRGIIYTAANLRSLPPVLSDCCRAEINDGYCSDCGYSDDGRHN